MVAIGRAGVSVTVLEQAAQLREIGAGLQVSPNGLAVLRALGLEPELRQRGALQAQAVSLRDYQRRGEVARLDLKRLAVNQTYYFIHRADLLDTLIGAAKRASADIRLGQTVTEVCHGDMPEVHLAGGAKLRAELVIGADGVHSITRSLLNPNSASFFTKQVAWRAVVPNVTGQPAEARIYMGPGKHIVAYPLRGGEWVNLVAVEERDTWQDEGWQHKGDPQDLRDTFSDFGAEPKTLLEHVKAANVWGLFRHPIANQWFDKNIAMVGDAAHPMLPFLAQGANMALEDAWVLGHLAQSDRLPSFQSIRAARVEKVIQTTQGNAKRYHLRSGPMRTMAHAGLKTVSTLAPKLMLKPFDWLYNHDVTDKRF